jgi:hypothetical protein
VTCDIVSAPSPPHTVFLTLPRLLMLQARLGRRINELCMLDHDPLSMPGHPSGDQDPRAFVARLRYQQTKIGGAPGTILVDAEIVAIIQAQQDWAAGYFTACGRPGRTPRYLFPGSMMNRNGDRPYNAGQFRSLLTELAARSGIRDGDGRTIDLQRTHTFRHTAATSLLNAGVPLHVVQRWLGHLTPAMTMAYAQTLAETAEAEFLRYRKLTSDGRETTLNPEDLYDMLQLDQRTDRILPHGYCTLPPRQSCDRGASEKMHQFAGEIPSHWRGLTGDPLVACGGPQPGRCGRSRGLRGGRRGSPGRGRGARRRA